MKREWKEVLILSSRAQVKPSQGIIIKLERLAKSTKRLTWRFRTNLKQLRRLGALSHSKKNHQKHREQLHLLYSLFYKSEIFFLGFMKEGQRTVHTPQPSLKCLLWGWKLFLQLLDYTTLWTFRGLKKLSRRFSRILPRLSSSLSIFSFMPLKKEIAVHLWDGIIRFLSKLYATLQLSSPLYFCLFRLTMIISSYIPRHTTRLYLTNFVPVTD